jgi:hypothetical protein
LTDYPGGGHELCYWDNEGANSDTVFGFWLTIEQATDLFKNMNRWSYFNWQGIGVGIYKGYASVWVGEQLDPLPEPAICSGEEVVVMPEPEPPKDVISAPTGRFYLIFGSFQSIDDALSEREIFDDAGFYQAKVLIKEETFRVSLSDHATMEEARTAKSRLPDEYKEAWILKF